MGVISETLKSMRSTHKRSFEFEKTDERRRGEAFEKEKVIVKDFSFPVNLRRLPRWLLPCHLNASSWSKSCRLSCLRVRCHSTQLRHSRGEELTNSNSFMRFSFFTASCCNLAILQGGALSLKNTISEAPLLLICCRLTSHLIALK